MEMQQNSTRTQIDMPIAGLLPPGKYELPPVEERDTDCSAQAATLRGARMLDYKVPDWYRRIDTSTLYMASGCECICGQIWADQTDEENGINCGYEYAVEQWGEFIEVISDDGPKTMNWSIYYGFDTYSGAYTELGEEWKNRIQERIAGY